MDKCLQRLGLVRFLMVSFLALGGGGQVHASVGITLSDVDGDAIYCDAASITQSGNGDLTVATPSCLSAIEDQGTTVNALILGSKRCGFGSMHMDSQGRVSITASTACVLAEPIVFLLRDDRFQMECETDLVTQLGTGSLVLDGASCTHSIRDEGTFSTTAMVFKESSMERSCAFSSFSMDADGRIVITAEGECFGDSDGDLIPDPLDSDNSTMATADCLVQGDSVWETVNIADARYRADETCELPRPDYLVATDVVVGGVGHVLSYPPDTAVNVDYYATNSILLLGPVSVKGGSTLRVDSGRETRIWGPFKVTPGSVFRVVPMILIHED